MATQGVNSVMNGVTGMFNKQVVFKTRRGKRYVAGPPNHNRKRKAGTSEQKNRDRFKASNTYAAMVVKDPATKALYEAKAAQHQTANNVAFSDAFHPPKIVGLITNGYLGNAGDVITIQAKDNFKVVSVKVAMLDENDQLIEEGDAVDNGDELNWIYAVTSNIRGAKFVVRAYDMPQNETVKEFLI